MTTAILASEIIESASEIAQDEANVVWGTGQALRWVNDAQRAVALNRPDASVSTIVNQLEPGTRQRIINRRILSVIRNMGNDGLTPGYAPRLVERGMLDEFNPNWHAESPGEIVFEYIWDKRDPRTYYVNPPVTSLDDVYLELVVAVDPPPLQTLADNIVIDDSYGPCLTEWVCYRFFARDAEEVPDAQRAAAHFQRFFQILGIKTQADQAVSPKLREHLK